MECFFLAPAKGCSLELQQKGNLGPKVTLPDWRTDKRADNEIKGSETKRILQILCRYYTDPGTWTQYSDITHILQILHICYTYNTQIFHRYYTYFTQIFHRYSTYITHRYFTDITRTLHRYFTYITHISHRYFTDITHI